MSKPHDLVESDEVCALCGTSDELPDGNCAYCAEHYKDELEMAKCCGKSVGEMKKLQLVCLGDGGWWKRGGQTYWELLDAGAGNPSDVAVS